MVENLNIALSQCRVSTASKSKYVCNNSPQKSIFQIEGETEDEWRRKRELPTFTIVRSITINRSYHLSLSFSPHNTLKEIKKKKKDVEKKVSNDDDI